MDPQVAETVLPTLFWAVPVICLLVLIFTYFGFVARHKNDGRRRLVFTALWLLPFMVLLTLIAVFCGLGRCSASVASVIASSMLIAESGCLTLLRFRARVFINRLEGNRKTALEMLRDAVILVSIVAIAFYSLELPWNELVAQIATNFLLADLFIIAIPFAVLYFLGGRRGALLLIPLVAWVALGFAQYFVSMFKQAAIVPSDLLALGTALSVGGGYSYTLGSVQLASLAICSAGMCLLSFMVPGRSCDEHLLKRSGYRAAALRLGGSLGVMVAAGVAFTSVNLTDVCGFTPFFWDTLNVYKTQGMAGSFVSLIQNSKIQQPTDYSATEANDLLAAYAARYDATWGASENRAASEDQFIDVQPTVIAIMNESFSDLSIYNELNVGYQGPAVLKSIGDALYVGSVYTSVLGGGTCNSEFEFLTNISMWAVGTQNQPYVQSNLSQIQSLPRLFADYGYAVTAIHPNAASNWNRESAYRQLGFDGFLDISSFGADPPVRHAGVADATTYDKILELLQEDDAPQFIFDVTMQNHGGYDTFDLSEEERLPYDLSWLGEPTATQTAEYISLINTSERDLVSFIDQLRSLDRPVVLVFFGDHQPSMGSPINSALNGGADLSDPSAFQRTYQTPYFIWANYDVAGNDQVSEHRDLGLYSLSSLLLQSIGAPMSDLQKATMVIMDEVPILNGFGFQTADGAWHSFDDANSADGAVRDLEWLLYLEGTSRL